MLHKDPFIVTPSTFALIQQLQAVPELFDFHLVGGTALALQIGHRNSIDIDLFTENDFAPESLVRLLKPTFAVETSFQTNNTLLSIVNGIKVDFITDLIPWFSPLYPKRVSRCFPSPTLRP
jgi:hypothetical protein